MKDVTESKTELPSEEKKSIILVVFNLPDGTGDFGHGRDIYEAINRLEEMQNYNIDVKERAARQHIYTDLLQKKYLEILQGYQNDPQLIDNSEALLKNPAHLKFIEFDVSGETFNKENSTDDLKQAIHTLASQRQSTLGL